MHSLRGGWQTQYSCDPIRAYLPKTSPNAAAGPDAPQGGENGGPWADGLIQDCDRPGAFSNFYFIFKTYTMSSGGYVFNEHGERIFFNEEERRAFIEAVEYEADG